ncbi:11642_t:CDS:2, partial [Gigaspora margarita]
IKKINELRSRIKQDKKNKLEEEKSICRYTDFEESLNDLDKTLEVK